MCLLHFFGCLPTVFRPRGAVFTCGADIYLRCYRLHGGCGFEYTSGGSCGRACIIPPKSMGYLPPVEHRSLCLTAWGCIPPVVSPTLGGSRFEYTSGGSCGRACNTRPRIGTFTCGATWTTTCGAITSAVGVHLSIPPVAPADVPALFHPRIRTFTCGATNFYLRC